MPLIMRLFSAYIFLIASLILAQGNLVKLSSLSGLPDLGNSLMGVADFNNDGYPDIVITGSDLDGLYQGGIYFNNSFSGFYNSGNSLVKLINGNISVNDYNNDGNIDFLISGNTLTNRKQTQLYRNNGNETFSIVNKNLLGLDFSMSAWADIDQDGDEDFFLSGLDSLNKCQNRIYLNHKGDFTEKKLTGIPPLYRGQVAIAHLNDDLFPDIFISGIDSNNNYHTDVYIGNGVGFFYPKQLSLHQVAYSSVAIADYNADGYNDIAYTGIDQSGNRRLGIFRNVLGAAFQEVLHSAAPVNNGSISWFDYNADGYSDIAYCGNNSGSGQRLQILTFNGISAFETATETLIPISSGKVVYIDFDRDQKLDLIASGFSTGGPITHLYKNTMAGINMPPNTPTGLKTVIKQDTVKFQWSPAIDDHTPSSALTYRIWLSTTTSSFSVFAPKSNTVTGYNKIQKPGEYSTTSTGWFYNLPEGKYYWSVQAIDGALAAGMFAPTDSFAICKNITIGSDTAICSGLALPKSKGTLSDRVSWSYRTHNKLVTQSGFNFAPIISDSGIIAIRLTKSYGCTLSDSIKVAKLRLPVGQLPIEVKQCFKDTFRVVQTGVADSVIWWRHNSLLVYSKTFTGITLRKDTLYTKLVSSFGCISYDTVHIDTLSLPRFSINDTTICYKDPVVLALSFSGTLIWKSSIGITATGPVFNMSRIDTTFKVFITRTDQNNCKFTDTSSVISLQLPIARAGKDSIICKNYTIQLGADTVATKGKYPYTYLWKTLTDSTIARPTVTINRDTTFILKITDANGCRNFDTISIKVNPTSVLNPGRDTLICFGDSIRLGGKPTARNSFFAYKYHWMPGNYTSANPTVFPHTTTTYLLKVNTYNCPTDSAKITVKIKALPIPTLSADTITIGLGDRGYVSAFGGVYYRWFPDEFISNTQVQSPTFYPDFTKSYYVEIMDSIGCRSHDTLTVQVRNQLFIPNTFSPNGDGNNDTFYVYGTGVKQLTIKIFSPSEELVFESSDFQNFKSEGWDGTYRGNKLPQGTYVWYISGVDYADNPLSHEGKVRGYLNLIR